MTPAQLEELWRVKRKPVPPLTVDDLTDKSERTLLLGYDCDHNTHHVFIRGNRIQLFVYSFRGTYEEHIDSFTKDSDFVPNKRVYPTRSDFEFCRKLLERGVYITFTTPNEKELQRPRIGGIYYGHTNKASLDAERAAFAEVARCA